MNASSAARETLAQRPPGWVALHMRWEKLLFLHWRWDPTEIQARLPVGLHVDTFEGEAWLGIVPFYMQRVRPSLLPAVPWLSDFLELNVRTYVVDAQGRPGVWFFSLACNHPVAVVVARGTFGLNYIHAKMRATLDASGWCDYECQRKGAAPARFRYRPTTIGRRAEVDTLEHFLVERYMLFAKAPGGKLVCGRVHHPRYEIAPAGGVEGDFAPATADGFSNPGRPADHIAVARDLQVEAWPPQVVT